MADQPVTVGDLVAAVSEWAEDRPVFIFLDDDVAPRPVTHVGRMAIHVEGVEHPVPVPLLVVGEG